MNHRCVALLYTLFINDLNVQVSDTTKMSKEQKLDTKNIDPSLNRRTIFIMVKLF